MTEHIKAFQKGDETAFEIIMKSEEGWVRGLVARTLNHREDADDVAQEVFVKVYFGLKNFRFEADFNSWLYRIVMNQINSYFRKEKLLNIFRADSDVEASVEEKEQEEHTLMQLGGKLKQRERNVLLLRIFQDLNFREIAQIMKVTESTARVTFKNAKDRLKKIAVKYELGTV